MTITLPSVGVIGCGNYGLMFALDYNRRTGNTAKVYATPKHRRIFDRARQQGRIEATEAMTGHYYVDFVDELPVLLAYSQYIIVSLPSNAHDDILLRLAPFREILFNKTFIFVSGNGIAPRAFHDLHPKNVVETSRAPYTCRIEEPESPTGKVKCRMNGFKTRVITASYLELDHATISELQVIFGMPVEHYNNLLELLLVNNHGVLHPPTLLRGRYAIEKKAKMYTYRDLMSPPVCLEMEDADHELQLLAEALQCRKRESLLETLNGDYGTDYGDLVTFVRRIDALNKRPVLPPSLQSRMISQDVGVLGVLYASLGRLLGVQMPVIESWIQEASQLNGVDYWKTGRTLEYYGVPNDATREDILSLYNASH